MAGVETVRGAAAPSSTGPADTGSWAPDCREMEARPTRRIDATKRDIILTTAGLVIVQYVVNVAVITFFIVM
ncbi:MULTISPECIES: hypothetical protein [Methylobacterium]|uniref:hypothetical protein n=1 Tax=Methylobacterium TaxID=407 RepID=UPI0013EA46E5|nr:hypothetical protein [Methylobacterium sp. DB0501]NGM33926.1 hypothetical protein [Methylobacterium sp. DB0501]